MKPTAATVATPVTTPGCSRSKTTMSTSLSPLDSVYAPHARSRYWKSRTRCDEYRYAKIRSWIANATVETNVSNSGTGIASSDSTSVRRQIPSRTTVDHNSALAGMPVFHRGTPFQSETPREHRLARFIVNPSFRAETGAGGAARGHVNYFARFAFGTPAALYERGKGAHAHEAYTRSRDRPCHHAGRDPGAA